MAEQRVVEYLHKHHVHFSTCHHEPAFTAQEIAEKAHISGHRLAKSVVVKLDGKLAMCVLPATRRVNFSRLRQAAGCKTAELASEDEFTECFPHCEPGTMPPFGELYEMPVYADDSLKKTRPVAFNSGDSSELLMLSWEDYQQLTHPVMLTKQQISALG